MKNKEIQSTIKNDKGKKKPIIIGASIGAVVIIGAIAFIINGNKITQIKSSDVVELGDAYSIENPADYFTTGCLVDKNGFTVDLSTVDSLKAGDYTAKINYKDKAFNVAVTVADTVKPMIKAKENIEAVEVGTVLNPSDYVEVTEISDYKVYFVAEDGDVESLTIPDTLTYEDNVTEIYYTVVAVDGSDNRSDEITISIPIHIEEPEDMEEPEQSEQNSGGEANIAGEDVTDEDENVDHTTEAPDTTPAPAPAPQPAPQPQAVPQPAPVTGGAFPVMQDVDWNNVDVDPALAGLKFTGE